MNKPELERIFKSLQGKVAFDQKEKAAQELA